METTSKNLDSIVVIGAGECGARAVAELRGRGFAGSITLIGEEAHFPYERPPLSKAALTAGADEKTPQPVTVADEARLADLEVAVQTETRVTRIDREHKVVLAARVASGEASGDRPGATAGDGIRDEFVELPYDRLLLATGARSRPLPIEGAEHALLLRTYADALRLRAGLTAGDHVVVIGAGFIGLEVAASARQRGCRVTVLELAPRALARAVPAELADMLVARHVEEGVDIRFDVNVERIDTVDDGGFVVELASGPQVPADLVVAGIGAEPNVDLAAEAGLECDNGIAVDELLQTSDPDIFAAGDCCSFPHGLYGGRRIRLESWRNAHDQAVVAAVNLLGGGESYVTVPWFWSDQYDRGLQLAGLFDDAAFTVARDRADGVSVLFGLADDGRLVASAAVGAGASVAKDVRVAEMMIGKQARPAIDQLTDPDVNLKKLLRAED